MAAPSAGYSASGGAGGTAGPSAATAATYGSGQDGSGWVVNFSGMQSASFQQDKSGSGSGGVPGVGGGSAALSGIPQAAWLGLAAIGLAFVGMLAWRSRA